VKILTACEKRQLEVHAHGYRNAQRLTSLILLLRYSGMRIRDAVALSSDRLKGNKLFLYSAKTGTAVKDWQRKTQGNFRPCRCR
jgi:hypothetical protein